MKVQHLVLELEATMHWGDISQAYCDTTEMDPFHTRGTADWVKKSLVHLLKGRSSAARSLPLPRLRIYLSPIKNIAWS